jgi:hypothetical protein
MYVTSIVILYIAVNVVYASSKLFFTRSFVDSHDDHDHDEEDHDEHEDEGEM